MKFGFGKKILTLFIFPIVFPFALMRVLFGRVNRPRLVEDSREGILSKENIKKIITIPSEDIIDPEDQKGFDENGNRREQQIEEETREKRQRALELLENELEEKRVESFYAIEEEIACKEAILLKIEKGLEEKEEKQRDLSSSLSTLLQKEQTIQEHLDQMNEEEFQIKRKETLDQLAKEIEGKRDESFSAIVEDIAAQKSILAQVEKSLSEQEERYKEVTSALSLLKQQENRTQEHLDQMNSEEKYILDQKKSLQNNQAEETGKERESSLLALDDEIAEVRKLRQNNLTEEFERMAERLKLEIKDRRENEFQKIENEFRHIREREQTKMEQELKKQKEDNGISNESVDRIEGPSPVSKHVETVEDRYKGKSHKQFASLKQSMAAQLQMDLNRQEEELQKEFAQKRNSGLKKLKLEIDVTRNEALEQIKAELAELQSKKNDSYHLTEEMQIWKKREENDFLDKKEILQANLKQDVKKQREKELLLLNQELDILTAQKTAALEKEFEQREERFKQELSEKRGSALENVEKEVSQCKVERFAQIEQEIEDEKVKKLEMQEKELHQEFAENQKQNIKKINIELESEKEQRVIALQEEIAALKEKELREMQNEKSKAIASLEEWSIREENRLKERLEKDYKLLQIKLRDELELKIQSESAAIQQRFTSLAEEQKANAEKDIKGYLNKKFSRFFFKKN